MKPDAPADGNADTGETAEDKPAQITINKWQFVSLVAVLVTLVVVLIAAFAFKGNTDSVTGIIGAALPPFATIAAAIFGIKAVYESGKATGEASGKAAGEANKAGAVEDAKDETARAITKPLRQAEPAATFELIERVRNAADSPHGSSTFRLFGPDPSQRVELAGDLLDRAGRPSREVETALAIAEQYMRR